MARNKGTFNLSANFQVKMQEALDPRMVVEKKSDLISKETWSYDENTLYVYRGMVVGVAEEHTVYILTDVSKALLDDYSGWTRIGQTDNELSDTSENAVQNQIVTKEFAEIRNLIKEKPSYDIVDGVQSPDGETPSFVTTKEFEELMARVHALEQSVIQAIFRE